MTMAIELNNDVRVPVRVQVNKAGMAEKNAEFLAVNRKIDEVAAEKAAASADYNERLKALRLQRKTLMDVMDEGFETVQVDAYERVNEQLMQIETVRRDTGKVVDELTRPMSADERQLSIDDVKPRGRGKRAETADEAPASEAKPKRSRSRKAAEQAEATAE
jgi:hypothetical protein